MLALYLWLKNWFAREEGQDLIEYALILVLLVIVAYLGLSAIGVTVSGIWIKVNQALGTVAS